MTNVHAGPETMGRRAIYDRPGLRLKIFDIMKEHELSVCGLVYVAKNGAHDFEDIAADDISDEEIEKMISDSKHMQSYLSDVLKRRHQDPDVAAFNSLSGREKWRLFRDTDFNWHCPKCGEQDETDPRRCSPFHRAEICCGNCDATLTRRTGGGQNDPFLWEARKGE